MKNLKKLSTLEELSTLERLDRHTKHWSMLAGETVEIKIYDNDIYAFGSEFACLRLYYKFRHCEVDKIRVDFSKPSGSWFFSLIK
jgi:hypothetical protein